MKIIVCLISLLGLVVTDAFAHTMGMVKFKCPIDATAFEAMQDFSGTSFGARLDMKRTGPIAQPWKLAQCPTCHLPLFKEEFEAEELEMLKRILASEAFAVATKDASAYFTLGFIKEALGKEPLEVAWTYLYASWEVENDQERYSSSCKLAIAWCDKAANAWKEEKDKRDDYLFAKYLPIELSRRLGDFDAADQRLKAFPHTTGTEIEWLDDTLRFQTVLVKAKDSLPHQFGENEKPATE